MAWRPCKGPRHCYLVQWLPKAFVSKSGDVGSLQPPLLDRGAVVWVPHDMPFKPCKRQDYSSLDMTHVAHQGTARKGGSDCPHAETT